MDPNRSNSSQTGALARQKLLAILGQVQTYVFQIELLKRCDPSAVMKCRCALKLNAIMIRYLLNELGPGLAIQTSTSLTPMTYAVRLALRYADREGTKLADAIDAFSTHGNVRLFFNSTMDISGPCRHHHNVSVLTYGGQVNAEIKFMHDIENVLKQLNYCHLITPVSESISLLKNLDAFLETTLGSGLVVPPELFDPLNPCFVCFEELCVTANQGETVHRRLAGKMCDHVTRQIVVRVSPDELFLHLPHISGIPENRRRAAVRALDQLRRRVHNLSHTNVSDDCKNADRCNEGSKARYTADALLESHNVFIPASRKLYAVSELRFWLASSENGTGSSTLGAFADNLDALAEREKRFDTESAAAELAIFGKPMDHFDRVFSSEASNLDVIDSLLLGSRSASPDDQIEALIRACYDHHLSAPLLRSLANPDKTNEDALKRILENASDQSYAGDESDDDDVLDTQVDDRSEGSRPWHELVSRAMADVRERRKMYAERLSKRSLASLGRCVREQRSELEKTLRVNVFGEVLLNTFVAINNGFKARLKLFETIQKAGRIIDNSNSTEAFDAHRFMRTSLLRHKVDPAMLPSLTHKFYELINGPLFDHDTHTFAQPPNTSLYFSVENVGLLPHLKEELARFVANAYCSDWTVSSFQRFYYFDGVKGVTAAQRLAWKYIREFVLASALFSSVFHCGEVKLRRADRTVYGSDGYQQCEDGIYLTYETDRPLIAVFGTERGATVGRNTTVILDRDVFSLLYSVLQKLAPGAAEKARETTNTDHVY
ncbi:DNA packaging terminase subunit 2 [Spheniscid alphaherpesvirus 1]|uniref:DNA packaging terminase subunit 2 n=1 Tax=Spheniscid alphaherpesvirus 1 TaxID=2560777 RepID=A0A1R3T3K6_9ALPH|nr:DNA packaging terminase subunit 2 [Spheniscid alphaherpesvirus 1]